MTTRENCTVSLLTQKNRVFKELTTMVGEYIFGEKINICDEDNEKGYPEYRGKEYNVYK